MSSNPKISREALLEVMKRQVSGLDANDSKAIQELSAIDDGSYDDRERKRAETETIRQQNEDRRLNRELRVSYATKVFKYLSYYSVFVAEVLIYSGFNVYGFSLPDSVLTFLVGSTAAAAIGLVFAVTNNLFKNING
ncbi:MAG: hypothetical protein ACPGVK_10860 [Halocynthiibacter sp.]